MEVSYANDSHDSYFFYSILPVGISSSTTGGGVVSVILPEGGSAGVGVAGADVAAPGGGCVVPVFVVVPLLEVGASDILPEGTSAEAVGVGDGVEV